jgi:hypothetical protein
VKEFDEFFVSFEAHRLSRMVLGTRSWEGLTEGEKWGPRSRTGFLKAYLEAAENAAHDQGKVFKRVSFEELGRVSVY